MNDPVGLGGDAVELAAERTAAVGTAADGMAAEGHSVPGMTVAGQASQVMATAGTVALAERYAPGEAAGPLLRALTGGLFGALVALALDRIWPEPFLALGVAADGQVRSLPFGLLLPSMAADLALGQPERWTLGVLVITLSLMLINFIYVYGQFRRFVPGGDLRRGLLWGLLLALLGAGTLLPRVGAWLEPAIQGRGAGLQLAAAFLVVLEFAAALAAYGLTVALVSPAGGEPS